MCDDGRPARSLDLTVKLQNVSGRRFLLSLSLPLSFPGTSGTSNKRKITGTTSASALEVAQVSQYAPKVLVKDTDCMTDSMFPDVSFRSRGEKKMVLVPSSMFARHVLAMEGRCVPWGTRKAYGVRIRQGNQCSQVGCPRVTRFTFKRVYPAIIGANSSIYLRLDDLLFDKVLDGLPVPRLSIGIVCQTSPTAIQRPRRLKHHV